MIMIGFPICYILLTGIWFNIPARNYASILISPLFYFVSFWAVLSGYGLWEMKRWAWYVFIFAQILILYENANIVSNYSESQYRGGAFLMALFIQVIITYRITREVRVPYFLPKIRWWASYLEESPVLETEIKKEDGVSLKGEVLDVSVFGCFVKIQNNFVTNESVSVKFEVKGEEFECQGWVVWKTESAVTHPKGIGIKFEKLNRKIRKNLKSAINDYKKEVNNASLSSIT